MDRSHLWTSSTSEDPKYLVDRDELEQAEADDDSYGSSNNTRELTANKYDRLDEPIPSDDTLTSLSPIQEELGKSLPVPIRNPAHTLSLRQRQRRRSNQEQTRRLKEEEAEERHTGRHEGDPHDEDLYHGIELHHQSQKDMADPDSHTKGKRPNIVSRHSAGVGKRRNVSTLQLTHGHPTSHLRKNMSDTSLRRNRSSGHLSKLTAHTTGKVPSKKAQRKKRGSVHSDRSGRTNTDESDENTEEEEVDEGRWKADATSTLKDARPNEDHSEPGESDDEAPQASHVAPTEVKENIPPRPTADRNASINSMASGNSETTLPTPPPSTGKSYEDPMLTMLKRHISFDKPTTATDRTPAMSSSTSKTLSSSQLSLPSGELSQTPTPPASRQATTTPPALSTGFLDTGPRQTSTQQKLNLKRAEWSKEENTRPRNEQSGLGAYVGFNWRRLTEAQRQTNEQEVYKRVDDDYNAMLRSGRNPMMELIAEYQKKGRIPGPKKEALHK